MQKISLFFLILFMQMLLISPVLFSQSPGGIPIVDHRYCLSYLLAAEQEQIDQEIRRLEAFLESPGSNTSKGELDRVRYAAGVLHSYRYIRTEKKDDAFRSKDLLETVQEGFDDQELFTVHLGMAHAFVAGIRTIFGVSNLKKMEEELQSIPEKHPDWLIRFLRGTTSLQVGRALPGVFTIKDIKRQAIEVGSEDLRYVIRLYEQSGIEDFDPASYNFDRRPVPRAVAAQARKVLEE